MSLYRLESVVNTLANISRARSGVPFADWPLLSWWEFWDEFGVLPNEIQSRAVENMESWGFRFVVFDAIGNSIVMGRPGDDGQQHRVIVMSCGTIIDDGVA